MGHKEDIEGSPARAAFVRELRKILPNLYNPGLVRHSPLIALFGFERRRDAPAVLQRLLTQAIEALEPDADVPVGSHAWRVYQILHARYIDQFGQEEVARDLFLSPRQLRRQEQSAVEVLADHLWAAHNLEQRAELLEEPAEDEPESESAADSGPSGRDEELAWLERTLSSEVVDCVELVQSALHTARPLIESIQTRVLFEPPESLPPLSIQQTPVRQALLHLITLAARAAGSGQVTILAEVLPHHFFVRLRITAQPGGPPSASAASASAASAPATATAASTAEPSPADSSSAALPSSSEQEGLEMAHKLIQLSHGAFEARVEKGKTPFFSVAVTLPTAEQVPILVVDDNVDTLHLVERYLAGTRYRFIGAGHPREALELAERAAPSAILMDVMLPDMDGWDLLGRFRTHPVTHSTPVIVCTILPQAQLALMLGAAEFISKPIRREGLLSALDRLVGLASPESA